MTKLTNSNYFTPEANRDYWSVSQFKEFDKCEAAGLAAVRGEYTRPETDALLVGSYVDAYFAGELDAFRARAGDKLFKKNGGLYSKFENANDMINRISREPVLLEFLSGEKQVIQTGELFGVPWKIKMDAFDGERIVDLKTVRDFEPIYKPGFGRLSWIEYWGYDIQGAIYQKIVEQNTGKRLPFYIVAVTKETTPDVDLLEIPQPMLDAAFKIVENKIDEFDLVKTGEMKPRRCGSCDYCKRTKTITGPRTFEPLEGK